MATVLEERESSTCKSVKLGDLLRKRVAKVAPAEAPDLPFVGLDAIAPNGMKLLGSVPFGSLRSGGSRFEPGDVLYGRLRPYLNKVWLADRVGAASGEFFVLQCSPQLDPSYLAYLLHSRSFVDYASHRVTGDRPRLDYSHLASFEVILPPLDEQRRIISHVNQLITELEDGEEELRRARKDLETYRKSFLQAAVIGEITADWRALNDPTETGGQLLRRLVRERRERWDANPKNKGKEYTEPPDPQQNRAVRLPAGWAWASWSQLGDSQNGKAFPSAHYCDAGIKLLRPGNLFADGYVRWTNKNTRYLPEAYAEREAGLLVSGGELVMNLTAQSLADEFLGRVCLTQAGEKCLLNQRLARLTPHGVNVSYVWLVLRSTLFRAFVDRLNTGSMIQHMYTRQLATFAVPLPPAGEQAEIVRRASIALETIELLEESLDQAANTSVLRGSILAAAFRGELAQ